MNEVVAPLLKVLLMKRSIFPILTVVISLLLIVLCLYWSSSCLVVLIYHGSVSNHLASSHVSFLFAINN